ncbi:hypothetical protein BDV96DRAFT_387720 [Lophiotrema nucula]|uniref:Condensation domain-containing protein n=1 Tax=Lophiotrema nucula TaxID=690887 RepID=A0A6A5ZG92_9PLEO|nr:hypothetical protein BDV96DRAFT_387720 [Lophiotrema nucula]
MTAQSPQNWLARYAKNYHAWTAYTINGRNIYERSLGLVESSFDLDGTDYEGRADMNALFTLEIKHSFSSKVEFRHRIALAWTNLRLQHTLLMSRVCEDEETGKRCFVVDVGQSAEEVIQKATDNIVWVEDIYPSVDSSELHRHCQNVARILDPTTCLSRLHVLPLIKLPNGNFELRFLLIMAHQISDGLTFYNWFRHFIRILNMPASQIEEDIKSFRREDSIVSRLPPAQEDLYPPIAGSQARQRWFWAIIRVLRHVRKSLPPTFTNPLRRKQRAPFMPLPPTFDKLLDYSKARQPPMNSFHVTASLSKTASTRIIQLCRSINVSVGAGLYALAGIAMMDIEEQRHPEAERRHFIASFPLNPRTFFGWTTPADSCMLAFSDGIAMPFLPSSLPLEGRLKLTARIANRQLRQYQKRLKTGQVNISLGAHSPGRLLASGYLYAIERLEGRIPEDRKTGINPQGELQASMNMAGATCGVSSVGSTATFFKPGEYDLEAEGRDFIADYRDLRMGVRARDNEFLVGSSTNSNGIVGFGVSYDGCAISEEAAKGWARKIESLLEEEDRARL